MPLEKLGEYDPIPRVRNSDHIPMANRVFGREHVPQPLEKKVEWDVSRIKWWLANGAKPTPTVLRLFQKVCQRPV